MGFLTVRTPAGRHIYRLSSATILGRSNACGVMLDDPGISKRHAEIRESDGRYLLKDLGSTNGTFVGGQRLMDEVSLHDGDEILIHQTRILFTRAAPPGAEEPPAAKNVTHAAARHGVLIAEGTAAAPAGTLSVPLEQFGLRDKDAAPTARTLASAVQEVGAWLRSLYRLLREGSLCVSENELFSTSTRILAETFPSTRVRIVFEAQAQAEPAAGRPDEAEPAATLAVWSDPTRRTGKTALLLKDELAPARVCLINYARERCVAVLSPDLEGDERAKGGTRIKKGTNVLPRPATGPRVSLLVAPLLTGHTALAYLTVEQTYRREYAIETDDKAKDKDKEKDSDKDAAQPKNIHDEVHQHGPFSAAHLEFIAAAAYPLAALLANIRRNQNVLDQNEKLRRTVADRYQIVGQSPALKACMAIVERVAPTRSPVLILGESGTGKELVARAIHALSPRRNGPFEAINCAALPENLIESELFGHVKGAFTGAVKDRAGCFESATGGTLFLDEIGELPFPMQVKLLRVLQESKLARVGESRLRDIDCRIVTATNRNLSAEVAAGRFRQDLYYRLRVMDVTLPPLRERPDDLPVLCKHLLQPFGNFVLHPDVLAMFRRYRWPGNVRELRNTLERMAVLSRPENPTRTAGREDVTQLTVDDVPLDVRRAVMDAMPEEIATPRRRKTTLMAHKPPPQEPRAENNEFKIDAGGMLALEQLQAAYAQWVLKQLGGNKTKAAKLLGIQRSTLYAWTEWKGK